MTFAWDAVAPPVDCQLSYYYHYWRRRRRQQRPARAPRRQHWPVRAAPRHRMHSHYCCLYYCWRGRMGRCHNCWTPLPPMMTLRRSSHSADTSRQCRSNGILFAGEEYKNWQIVRIWIMAGCGFSFIQISIDASGWRSTWVNANDKYEWLGYVHGCLCEGWPDGFLPCWLNRIYHPSYRIVYFVFGWLLISIQNNGIKRSIVRNCS